MAKLKTQKKVADATLNETDKKLKDAWAKKVVGFIYVGNMNLSYTQKE